MVLITLKIAYRLIFPLPLGFRPLAGIMVLIGETKGMSPNSSYFMFPSPCGDYGSYRQTICRMENDGRLKFPSPCGDYGSYHTLYRKILKAKILKFPSPCGDYGSYLRLSRRCMTSSTHGVSVPLRGLWFLSTQ